MDWSRVIEEIEKNLIETGRKKSDLSKMLGVRSSYISDIRSGKSKNPGADFTLALINKLQINPLWLETGEGTPFLTTGAEAQGLDGESPASLSLQASIKVPLLRQKVSCGKGADWESEENIEDYIDVHTLIPRIGIGRVFAIKAQGSSMMGMGIRNGDYILFDAAEERVFNDDVYVFSLDGDLYCKRLEFDMLAQKINIFSVRFADLDKAELIKSIDTSDPSFGDRFMIFGKVSGWMHPKGNGD